MILHIDFETRSTVDLRKAGADVYSRHPSTEVVCMAWAFGDGEIEVDDVRRRGPPTAVSGHILRGGLVYAHNATFERLIWNAWMNGTTPQMGVGQVRCTMAMAYAMALPGRLDQAAAAVGLDAQKDMKGHRLMLQMSKPRRVEDDGTVVWWEDDDRLQRLMDYCKQDVAVERELHSRLRELPHG